MGWSVLGFPGFPRSWYCSDAEALVLIEIPGDGKVGNRGNPE